VARGGRRAGTRGASYSNRSDLRAALPLNAPTGLPYGDRQKLISAQRAIPMAPAPSGVPSGPPAQQPVGVPSPSTGAPTGPPPGAQPLLRPTERPNEPVSAGLPIGPGAGPEALGPLSQGAQGSTVAGLLQSLAASPNATPEVRQLASYAQSGK